MLSVCVLLFGPHPDLARKVLDSIADSAPPPDIVSDLRVGMNDVSQETTDYVFTWAGTRLPHLPISLYVPPWNVGKYPLMRRMFYDERHALADHVMWFDDDSHLLADTGPAWWQQVHKLALAHTQVGQRWRIAQRKLQYQGIRAQPWYRGLPLHPNYKYTFCTGGWWIANSNFLRTWNYPFPEIHHNGGDSILGELLRQQQQSMLHFDRGVAINVGGRKGRRGLGVALREEVYPWQNGAPVPPGSMPCHAFDCHIHRFAPIVS